VLEDANIKLASVATDILGVSGRAMLEALIQGQQDPPKLANLAQRPLRGKIPQLEKSLEGTSPSIIALCCGCCGNNWPNRRS
jgi:transposase